MKTIQAMTLLVLGGLAFTACSSDEQEPQAPEAQQWSVRIRATQGTDTRALTDNGDGTLLPTWESSDRVVVKSGSTTVGTLEATASSTASTTLVGDISGTYTANSSTLELTYYPRGQQQGATTLSYENQNGTLEGAQEYDFATATVKVTRVDAQNGVLETEVASFTPRQAILKLKFQDSDGNQVTGVKSVYVSSTHGDASAVLSSATDDYVYIAVPAGTEDTRQTFTFTVNTSANKTYRISRAMTVKNSLCYTSTLTGFSQYTGVPLSSVTSEHIGWVIWTDGNVYEPWAFGASGTRTAMVAYSGTAGSVDKSSGTYHGLAIALTDASTSAKWYSSDSGTQLTGYQNSTFATQISEDYRKGIEFTSTLNAIDGCAAAQAANSFSTARPASGTSGWFLPSAAQWYLVLTQAGLSWSAWGYSKEGQAGWNTNINGSDGLNAKLTAAGGTGFSAGYYWSSSELSTTYAVLVYFRAGGGVCVGNNTKSSARRVRAFLAF
ncbi:MAG: hypothetical protein IJ064_07415 [Bacteroidaceae bacterium]|nr:hypothetical protein [Bacteroidaceae bacterium]